MTKYEITELHANASTGCGGGNGGYDAEATLIVGGKELYAHLSDYAGSRMYTIGENSWDDDIDGEPEFIEQYEYEDGEDWDGSDESEYDYVFRLLKTMVDALEGE